MCQLGEFKKLNLSEWGYTNLIQPKKNGAVRLLSDYRKLNQRIGMKPFPIAKIQDMILNPEGFEYASSLDLIMGYYNIELLPGDKQLCTIVLPGGK